MSVCLSIAVDLCFVTTHGYDGDNKDDYDDYDDDWNDGDDYDSYNNDFQAFISPFSSFFISLFLL